MGQYDKDHLTFCDDGDYDDDDDDENTFQLSWSLKPTVSRSLLRRGSSIAGERVMVMMVIMKRMNNQLVSSINDELDIKMMLLLMLFTSRLVFCSLCLLVTSLPSFSRSRE